MKTINNEKDIRSINGGAKVYNCSFCHNYSTSSYWKMYKHAFGCSYCNHWAYNMGWNVVIGLLLKI